MSDKQPTPTKISEPTCPYCETSPMEYLTRLLTSHDGTQIAVFWCHNPECGRVINYQLCSLPQPSRIVRPGN